MGIAFSILRGPFFSGVKVALKGGSGEYLEQPALYSAHFSPGILQCLFYTQNASLGIMSKYSQGISAVILMR